MNTELFFELVLEKYCIKDELIKDLQMEMTRDKDAAAYASLYDYEDIKLHPEPTTQGLYEAYNKPKTANDTQAPPSSDEPTKFLGVHSIDITGGKRPILTPHKYHYPIRLGQPVTEVESHRF